MYNKDTLCLTEGSHFYMKLTMKEKLQMCEEHVMQEKTLSHVCERHNFKNKIKLKYWVNLYK